MALIWIHLITDYPTTTCSEYIMNAETDENVLLLKIIYLGFTRDEVGVCYIYRKILRILSLTESRLQYSWDGIVIP